MHRSSLILDRQPPLSKGKVRPKATRSTLVADQRVHLRNRQPCPVHRVPETSLRARIHGIAGQIDRGASRTNTVRPPPDAESFLQLMTPGQGRRQARAADSDAEHLVGKDQRILFGAAQRHVQPGPGRRDHPDPVPPPKELVRHRPPMGDHQTWSLNLWRPRQTGQVEGAFQRPVREAPQGGGALMRHDSSPVRCQGLQHRPLLPLRVSYGFGGDIDPPGWSYRGSVGLGMPEVSTVQPAFQEPTRKGSGSGQRFGRPSALVWLLLRHTPSPRGKLPGEDRRTVGCARLGAASSRMQACARGRASMDVRCWNSATN